MILYTKPIKVCNLDYEVVNEDDVLLNGEKANGYIVHDKAEIHIDKNLPLCLYKHYLKHEINHAIMLAFNLDIENDDVERFVDCMATGDLTVMRDNPSLVEFFMEEK